MDDFRFAVRSWESGRAFASEAIHTIGARAAVQAGVRFAIVDVGAARSVREPGRALACEVVEAVGASAVVQAWIRITLVDLRARGRGVAFVAVVTDAGGVCRTIAGIAVRVRSAREVGAHYYAAAVAHAAVGHHNHAIGEDNHAVEHHNHAVGEDDHAVDDHSAVRECAAIHHHRAVG